MKMYVTSRFKNASENKENIESLCLAVRNSGCEDFSFIRDVENFNPNHFDTQREVWGESLKYLKTCDALLIDVSDKPSGGRNVEAGMAYALGIPIYTIIKKGTDYKSFYDGLSAAVIEYEFFSDITEELRLIL